MAPAQEPPAGAIPDLDPATFVGPHPEGAEPDPRAMLDAILASRGIDGIWLARHAAMIETESAFRLDAESRWAQGWSQFTPPTRGDVWPKIAGCAEADPFDPYCSALAMDLYMRGLLRRSLQLVQDERAALAMARRGYNGGLGWQQREFTLCLATPGCDPNNSQHMAALCREAGRSEAACRENHSYAGKVARAEAGHRERQRKRGWGRKLLGVAKTAARTAVAVSPSPVGLDDLQRARQAVRRR